jgi:SWIM/SEC-C metal-binding protein
MGKRVFDGKKTGKLVEGRERGKIFAVKKPAKLGTEKNPAVLRVRTEERLKEVASIFQEKGWKYTIALEAEKPEDTSDFDRLLNPQEPVMAEKKVGRNEPCPCGSGKKHKKCCCR